MDWPTIHAYAEEAELWTTLAINCWLIVAGGVFAFGRMTQSGREIKNQVVRAALWGLFNVSTFALIALIIRTIFLFPELQNPDSMIFGTIRQWIEIEIGIAFVLLTSLSLISFWALRKGRVG